MNRERATDDRALVHWPAEKKVMSNSKEKHCSRRRRDRFAVIAPGAENTAPAAGGGDRVNARRRALATRPAAGLSF